MFTKAEVRKHFNKTKKNFNQFQGFEILRLKDFLKFYEEKITEDYLFKVKQRNSHSPYEILCLVDLREDIHDTMSKEKKKQYRNSGKIRRRRITRQYKYSNVFNRIHGFIALENMNGVRGIPNDKSVVSLSLICTSRFSNKKGVGSFLMETSVSLCKDKFTDIILEVANEFASSQGSDDESDDEYDDESEYEESEIYYINEEIVNKISIEFYRKTMRLREENGKLTTYFNISEEYIYGIIDSYMNDEHDTLDYYDDFPDFDLDEPGEYDYGGYFYHKGKESQIGLFRFYEKFGFKEVPEINYKWKIYTPDPFPTMMLSL
tara:strand:+ start:1498 stop:2454 length:957 start_codon:yes stop_codon:yes gene_type:complete